MVITQALAKINTIKGRINSKLQTLVQYAARADAIKDPITAEGGSAELCKRESQAIGDLCKHIVVLRGAIDQANRATPLTIDGETRSIADWLTWRREVAPIEKSVLDSVLKRISEVKAGVANAFRNMDKGTTTSSDVVVSFDEAMLAKEREHHQTCLGELDGALSLHNATVELPLSEAALALVAAA